MTIPGVKEDVLDILLRMKEVVLKSHSAQPQIGRLRVEGPATVTTAYFELPSEVEVINENQYIATVAAGHTLEMEFRVERGVGYRAIEKGKDDGSALDFLQIDSVFMPVRRVNYSIEDARVGGSLEKDRLVMELWTNGSITPQDALSQAASILVDLFTPLKDITIEEMKKIFPVEEDPHGQIPIEELQLSVRAYNCLKRAQINPQEIGAVYIGSESHPYAVKPSGTVLIDAIGIGPHVHVADFEFACKAGSEAMFVAYSHVKSGNMKYALGIGADTSQGAPGDALEYSASAGGSAYIFGTENV